MRIRFYSIFARSYWYKPVVDLMLSMQSLHCPVWKLKQYCPKIRDALTKAENGISETYTTLSKVIKELHPGGTYNSVTLYRFICGGGGGTGILYPEEFFQLGASTDSKYKTSAWLVYGFHTGICPCIELLDAFYLLAATVQTFLIEHFLFELRVSLF